MAKALSALPFRPNDRVLDIGVGTGLSLEFYPSCVHVTGIDLSEGMLAQAQHKLDTGAVRADCPQESPRLLQGEERVDESPIRGGTYAEDHRLK